MKIIDYVDFRGMFKKVKDNQLKYFPTKESYIEELKSINEDYAFVDKLYLMLEREDLDDMDFPNSDSQDDTLLRAYIDDNLLDIELTIGGNNSNENRDNYWGYGFVFTVNLEDELFVNYWEENYS